MAVNETKVTKIFVGSTAPTVNKNLIWCDTSKNYQLKKFIGTSNGVDQWKVLAASEASAITIEENGQKYILQDYVLALATELDNKANASDLASYLPLTGGVIENTNYSDSSVLTVSQNSWMNGKPILLVEDTYTNVGYTMDSGITVKGRSDGEEIYTFSTSILPNRIEGDAVTSSVTSRSDKLLTSGGAYTALQSKANTSDLSNYLKKTGDNSLELGTQYETEGTILLNSEYVDVSTYCTKITGNNGISIYSDVGAIWLDASGTGIVFGSTHNPNDTDNILFSVRYGGGITGTLIDTSLETELEDWEYDQHIATSKAIKSYVDTSVSNKANASDLSNYLPTSGGTISSNAHSALTINVTGQGGANVDGGLTVNNSYADLSSPDGDMHTNTTHYGATSITGDAVTDSIISGSNKLLTSGGAYTALQNYQLKLDHYSEIDTAARIQIGGGYIANSEGDITLYGASEVNITTANNGNIILNGSISGSAIVSTLGTSTTSTKLPTEGAVVTAVKAVNTSLANKQDKLTLVREDTSDDTLYLGNTEDSLYSWIRIGSYSMDLKLHSWDTTIGLEDGGGDIKILGSYITIGNLYTDEVKINSNSISGSAIATTIGTSETSAKLPTEGAVVKAISDVKTSLGSALTYEGSVENYSNLPTGLTTSDKGKVYNVVNANGDIPAGTNYAWNGTSWDALGGDLSAYQLKTDDSLTTTSKQIVGAINEINLKLDITTGPTPITSVYTVDSTALKAFITNTQYANVQGKISISPSIDNTGAIYFGQSITDKSQAFPLYPGQIMSFSFTDINTFMCATDTVGNKFNYVVEFGVVNKEPVMDYGIIIRSATGENYRLTPITDENGVPTLELESLAKIDSEQLAKYFEESTPNVKELTLVNGSEESQTVLQDKQGNILYTV